MRGTPAPIPPALSSGTPDPPAWDPGVPICLLGLLAGPSPAEEGKVRSIISLVIGRSALDSFSQLELMAPDSEFADTKMLQGNCY